MKIMSMKLNAVLIFMLLSISTCTETMLGATKHSKKISDMLDDFKIKYGESSSNNNKEVTGDENINFIQKNDDKVSDSIKQIADNLDEISGKVANNDHELNTDSSISFVEKKDKIKKTKTKAKAKKKKPSEKSIPRPKDIAYKIVKEKNPLLSDKKKLKFSYKKCSIKTGKINFLIKRPVAPTNTITIMPVFIMITTDKLILKKGEKKTNYIRSIPLVELQRIDQHYVNTFCFDIIIDEIVGKKLKAGQLTLCANNLAEMNMWVTTILDFKRCSIGVNSVDHNGKLVLDMNELNKFTRSGKSSLSNLFYSGKNKRRAKSRKEMKLSKTLSSMITSAQKGEIASHQLRRQFSGRLMKARSFEHEIEGKSYNLKRILANRVFREKEQEASAYAQRTARKEMRILRNVQQQMSSMSRSELSSYTTIYQNQINMQKELAKKKAMALMHIINEQDQLTDYRICFSPTFKNFKNKPKITAVCKQYYGKYGQNVCEERGSFCSMCCDFHIGVKFSNQRFSCRRKCEKIIKKEKKVKSSKKKVKSSKKNKKSSRKNKKSSRKNKKSSRKNKKSSRKNKKSSRKNLIRSKKNLIRSRNNKKSTKKNKNKKN